MKATLAILTIGVVPVSEVLPLLTEHVSEQQITHLSLLAGISREEVMEDYAIGTGEDPLPTMLSDGDWHTSPTKKWSGRYRASSKSSIIKDMTLFC